MPTKKKRVTKKRTTATTGTGKRTKKSASPPPSLRPNFSITMEPDLLHEVTEYAKAIGVSRSHLIETIVSDAFTKGRLAVQAMGNEAIRDAFLQAFSRPGVMTEMLSILGRNLSDEEHQMLLEFLRSSQDPPPTRT